MCDSVQRSAPPLQGIDERRESPLRAACVLFVNLCVFSTLFTLNLIADYRHIST